MNVSRLITGIILIAIGIFMIVIGIFLIAPLIWGIIFLVLGVIILLNKEEDEIEQIKYPKGHKYPRRKKWQR